MRKTKKSLFLDQLSSSQLEQNGNNEIPNVDKRPPIVAKSSKKVFTKAIQFDLIPFRNLNIPKQTQRDFCNVSKTPFQSHLNYLEYLRSEYKKAEDNKACHREKVIEYNNQANTLKREIYKIELGRKTENNAEFPICNVLWNSNKEKMLGQKIIIQKHKQIEKKKKENQQELRDREMKVAERLNDDRKMRIVKNLAKIRKRSELRKKQMICQI